MKDTTLLSHVGRDPTSTRGTVNMPVYRASTILFPTQEAYDKREDRRYDDVCYGTFGTPTTFALTDAMNALEGGEGSVVMSSGLAGCTMAILPFVSAGDHLLVPDSVYGPTRRFCDLMLKRFGVETTYYEPTLGAKMETLIKANTRVVFTEAPGSLTFEMQDIPAIAEAAHRHGCVVLMDNTWATPLYFKPLAHGVDVSIQAATKYISGHSDLVMGIATARTRDVYLKLKETAALMGEITSPDDCYLALRGLRSMSARMRVQQESALTIARWLEARPEVERVLYPPLESDPGHALWKRDFIGAGALFGVLLPKLSDAALGAMIDKYRYFGIGASWGGYESLVLTSHPGRTVTRWDDSARTLLRFSIGLEDPGDLIADLEEGFERLNKAR